MKVFSKILLGLLIAGFTQLVAFAADTKTNAIQVEDAWIRASAGGQTSGAGYMVIKNTSASPDRLLSATSAVAARVELHSTITEGGSSRMVEIKDVAIPANGSARFSPSGNHIMFLQIKGPFKEGEKVPVTLKFERSGETTVDFLVRPTTFNSGSAAHGKSHGDMK